MSETILTLNGVCKKYPTFKLQDVSFSLPRGYIMGFVGQNGSGKTTLISMIPRLYDPDAGEGLGMTQLLDGTDWALLGHGTSVHTLLEVRERAREWEGSVPLPAVFDIRRLKPLDTDALDKILRRAAQGHRCERLRRGRLPAWGHVHKSQGLRGQVRG